MKDFKKETDVKREIKKLKECVKEKDIRLRDQSDRIEKIENRYSIIIWAFLLSFISIGFVLLGVTMIHVYNNLPNAVIYEGGIFLDGINNTSIGSFEIVDALQLVGYYLICFLAFVGFIALIILCYVILHDDD